MAQPPPRDRESREDGVAQQARRLLELTRQMLHCAERGDWDGVTERNRLCEFQARSLPDDAGVLGAASARNALAESLELAARVRALMVAERNRLGEASREEQRGQQAADAYQRVSTQGRRFDQE